MSGVCWAQSPQHSQTVRGTKPRAKSSLRGEPTSSLGSTTRCGICVLCGIGVHRVLACVHTVMQTNIETTQDKNQKKHKQLSTHYGTINTVYINTVICHIFVPVFKYIQEYIWGYIVYRISSFPFLFAFDVGGLGFGFCVFAAGCRHALRSEWPFIVIINTG